MVPGETWTFQEYDFLYKNYCSRGPKYVAEQLNRTVASVSNKASKMDLLYGPYSEEERQYIKTYGESLKGALIFLMPDRCSTDFEEMTK